MEGKPQMTTSCFSRRVFLSKSLAGGVYAILGTSVLIRKAFGMGARDYPQGMQRVQGDVKINGMPAQIGSMVKIGDFITTGADSLAIFIIGRDVYLLRNNSNLHLDSEAQEDAKEKIMHVLRLLNGKMLSVFRRSQKRIVTTTAVVGVRGTGYYVEADNEKTYFCTCYGTATIQAKTSLQAKETVRTKHHEAPRYVYAGNQNKLIAKAPVINHTDAELILIESMVGRKPPFARQTGYKY